LPHELAELYGLRSRVLYGRHEVPEKVWSANFRVTEIAIASLQALIERRPELIGIESGERSRRVLLGLP
jgi:hypothetical protein